MIGIKETIQIYKNQVIAATQDSINYKERIDKAIEYIETIVKNTPSSTRKDYANMILIDYKKLLEILEGGK